MRNERQHVVYGQTEAYFSRLMRSPFMAYWIVIFSFWLAPSSLFSMAQTSASDSPAVRELERGWPPPRSTKPTVRRTWGPIIERHHAYTPSSPSSPAYLTTTSGPEGSLGPGHGGSPGNKVRSGSPTRPPRIVEGALMSNDTINTIF
ncbi:hypothetical protein EVAR_90454_1 [Eumeta japonica]|uniref:Transmembrane protein n=1 Tax=Eumeta variegata TaxID=151549 RepID=A0A4C1SKH4_EUMVA|nr:hypothetical protein EVAR_90454_1 [Eumeta japonica]